MRVLILVAVVLGLAATGAGEDDKRLRIGAYGPEETGYPFATFQGSAKDIRRLAVRGKDQYGRTHFLVHVRGGSTLIYDVRTASAGGDDHTTLAKRAAACIAPLEVRLRVAGLFDTKVKMEPLGLVRVEIPAHSIDAGADVAALVDRSGTFELRAAIGSSPAQGWAGTKDAFRAFKKKRIARWRKARRAMHRHLPAPDSSKRLVLEAGRDGSQPYHFTLVEEGEATNGFDRTMFASVAVLQPEDDVPTLEMKWAPGARERFEGWKASLGEREIVVLLHGEKYAVLDEDCITDDGLSVEVRHWPCRPLSSWAARLATVVAGPELPEALQFLARVDFEPDTGSFEVFAPIDPNGSLTVEVSALGVEGVEAVSHTRRHVPGHFLKYYFITLSYLGGRHCGLLPIELAVWKKYQETELLTFNVCITLTHYGSAPIAIMGGHMLGEWRDDGKEVMRRLGMAVKLEQPERRWAAVQALAGRAAAGTTPKEDVLAPLEPLVDDGNERVRVAAAAARTRLGGATDKDAVVLEKARASTDAWVRWTLARTRAPK